MRKQLQLKTQWWGNPHHRLFTIIVFIILASLDNTARGVLPPLYAVIARDLAVSEASLGLITSLSIFVIAITALGWGYWGDRRSRKPLLLYGTLIWSAAMLLTGLSRSYAQLLLFQLVAAVGIGCISSVGFSVISDFISPARRGLALSFWGLSQGGGAGAGALLGGTLGANSWPLPFFLIAGAGLAFAVLYLFAFEPERGRAEPELAPIFAAGGQYKHRIQWSDIRRILTIRTNVWLLLQAFISTVGYGSLVWVSRLFIAKVQADGYGLETATISGNLLSLLFQMGFYFAILAGYLGDRWQRHDTRGRAILGMISNWGAIPFNIVVFFMPLYGLNLPQQPGLVNLVLAVVASIFLNPWVTAIFLVSLMAVGLTSFDRPNRTALFTDANLPEHRGTVAGFLTVALGVGLAAGTALTGAAFAYLEAYYPPPLNFALGLALFQLFFIPAGFCYYRATKAVGRDIAAVRHTLTERAAAVL